MVAVAASVGEGNRGDEVELCSGPRMREGAYEAACDGFGPGSASTGFRLAAPPPRARLYTISAKGLNNDPDGNRGTDAGD